MTIRYITLPSGDLASYDDELTTYHDVMRRAIERFPEMYGYTPPTPVLPNPVTAGLSSGVDQLQSLLYSGGAAVSDAAGLEGLRRYLQEGAEQNLQESQAVGRPDLERIEDQTLASALPFAGYQLAKQVPMVAGAIGASILMPEVAIPAALTRALAVAPKLVGGGGLKAGAGIAAGKAALKAGRGLAQDIAGMLPFGATVGAGSMYQSSVEGGDPSPYAALALSPIYGAAEMFMPAVVKAGLGRRAGQLATGSAAERMLKTGAVAGLGEAGTESLQTEMEIPFNPNLTEAEKLSMRINAPVVGAGVGGAFGALAGVRGAPAAPVTPPPPAGLDALRPPPPAPPAVGGVPRPPPPPPPLPSAPPAALEAKAQLDELLAEGELTQDQYNEELARLAELGLPPAPPAGLGALRPPPSRPLPPVPPAVPAPPSPVEIEQQRQQAAEVERQKQVRAEILTRYGAATVTASDGTPIGTRFGGKIYNHTGDPESNPQLAAAVNKTIAADQAVVTSTPALQPVREKILAAANETGFIPAGTATPAKIDSVVKALNITAETPPEKVVQFIESQLTTLEGKTSEPVQVKRDFYNALLPQFGGQPKREVVDAIQERGTAEVLPSEQKEVGEPRGERGRVEPKVEGQEVAAEGKAQKIKPVATEPVPVLPIDATQVPEYEAAAIQYLTSGVSPELLASVVRSRGVEQDTGEKITTSLRAAGKFTGVTHEGERKRILKGLGQLQANAEAAGIAWDKAQELLGITEIAAEEAGIGEGVYEGGMRAVRAPSEEFEPSYGMERAETLEGESVITEEGDVDVPLDSISTEEILSDTVIQNAAENSLNKHPVALISLTAEAYGEGFSDLPPAQQLWFVGQTAQLVRASDGNAETFQQRFDQLKGGGYVKQSLESAASRGAEPSKAEPEAVGGRPQVSAEGIVTGTRGIEGVKVEVRKRRVVTKPEEGTKFSEAVGSVTRLADRFNALQDAVESAETEEVAAKAEAALEKFFETVPEKILRKVMAEAGERRGAVTTDRTSLEDLIEEAELSETAGAENPISAETLTSRLKAMFRSAPLFDRIVTIYETQSEAMKDLAGAKLSEKSEAFRNWFGNSKVMDAAGNPLVVYHGTVTDVAKLKVSPDGSLGAGIYLTPDPETAGQYAEGAGGNLMPSYVSMQNPLIIHTEARARDPMVSALVTLGMAEEKASKLVEKAYEEKGYVGKQVMSRARAQGYDGIMQYRDGVLAEIVAFAPDQVKTAFSASEKGRIQGFKTADGKSGLIAENIEDGQELGVFLHEVGVHLGMEKLIGKANMAWLDSKIKEWDKKNDGSPEALAAKAAIARSKESTTDDNAEGRIAYMVEELVNRGMNPQAVGSSPSHVWFRRLWAAAKVSLRKLGFKRADFSAQNLVDLAYGAAHIELEGAWHGTAADFRKFHHAYMGSGEGHHAYGWGTYLAQLEGIGRTYMKQDVARKSRKASVADLIFIDADSGEVIAVDTISAELEKLPAWRGVVAKVVAADDLHGLIEAAKTYALVKGVSLETKGWERKSPEGSLMRVASNVREDEFLDWDKPLSEQSENVKSAITEPVMAKAFERKKVGIPTGEDVYRAVVSMHKSKELASKYLDSIGIKGIKYLDSDSRDEGEGTRNLVIFNDKNIVRAVTYPGGKKDAPQFSELSDAKEALKKAEDRLAKAEGVSPNRADNLTQEVEKRKDWLAKAKVRRAEGTVFSEAAPSRTVSPTSPSKGVWEKAGAAFDRFFNDPMTMVKEHGLGWLSMDHLVEVAQGVNDKLVEYRDVSRKMQAMSKEWVYKAAKIDAEWGKLSNNEAKQLSDVMRAATRAGFDPETGVAPANTDERKVQNLYAKLTPAAVKVYKAARDHYSSARVERQRIASGVLTAAHDELIKKAKESGDKTKLASAEAKLKGQLEKLDEKFRKVKGPYFPLMRLGKWYVVGMSKELAELEAKDELSKPEQIRMSWMRKSEKHYTTSSYETKSQAKAAQKVLARTYAETRFNRAEEKSHAAGVLSAAGLQDVEAYINSSFDKEVASEIRTMMAELYYEALPEHHALKREMKREGVHGEEEDMRRVFAVSTIKSAHYMSRLKHADELRGALFAIRREGKKSSDSMEYYNEVVKRAKLSMDETSAPWADKIAAVSYLAHLGMNPAFVLTNASQVAMITAPWLAARTSVGKATAALGSAYRVAGDLIVSSYSDQGWRAELDWEGKVPKGVGDMLTTLLKRNLLDITIEHDLGATAELKHHALGDALKIGNLPVHITELANRAVTAIAAYNLAINELKLDQDGAVEFAAKAVSTTQLDYSSLNAPRHMQRVAGSAAAARIVMQFRKYQQGMLWLIGRSIYNALKGASPKEKAEARKTLLGLFTTTGVMAGSLGMPLAGTATWALSALAAFGGDDDEPWDARTEYLNWLTEIVGKDAAVAIAKGVPAWMLGIDLEKRVGLGDVASPLPFMRQGKTAREDAANALLAAAGAPVATAVDIWDGVSMMAEGNWMKGAEKVIPLKGVQNLVRGARYSMEGMTEKDGDLILPPDAFSASDIGAKMAGFATTKESIYYEATAAVNKAKQAAQDVRKKLLAEIAQNRIAGEPTDSAMKKIREFNSRHPEKGIRIDGSSIARSVKARRQVARERGESGLLKSKQAKPFLKEAAFAE